MQHEASLNRLDRYFCHYHNTALVISILQSNFFRILDSFMHTKRERISAQNICCSSWSQDIPLETYYKILFVRAN